MRFQELVAVCGATFPDEGLLLDDLELLVGDDEVSSSGDEQHHVAATFGTEDGCAIAVVSTNRSSDPPSASLDLVCVHPGRRRRGLGHGVVEAAEVWARNAGASSIGVGASGALGLFNGIDTRWTEALCLFEARGYERLDASLELRCQTTRSTRRPVSPTVVTENVVTDDQLAELIDFARANAPVHGVAVERGGSSGTAKLARGGTGAVVGAVVHSVTRMGVINPIITGSGVSRVGTDVSDSEVTTRLIDSVLADLAIAGLNTAVISGDYDLPACAKRLGASVSRSSLTYRRTLV